MFSVSFYNSFFSSGQWTEECHTFSHCCTRICHILCLIRAVDNLSGGKTRTNNNNKIASLSVTQAARWCTKSFMIDCFISLIKFSFNFIINNKTLWWNRYQQSCLCCITAPALPNRFLPLRSIMLAIVVTFKTKECRSTKVTKYTYCCATASFVYHNSSRPGNSTAIWIDAPSFRLKIFSPCFPPHSKLPTGYTHFYLST
jgi:hypothetical protein